MSALIALFDFVTKPKFQFAACALIAAFVIANLCYAQQTTQSRKSTEVQANNPQIEKSEITEIVLAGRFHLVTGTQHGVLILKAEIPEGSHIYALTQTGSPPPSKILVTDSKKFRIKGNFSADRNPKIVEFDPIFKGRLEKHYKLVQFYVPIQLSEDSDPAEIHPEIVFDGQVCSDRGTCMPIRGRKIKAEFAGYYDEQAQNQIDSQTRRR